MRWAVPGAAALAGLALLAGLAALRAQSRARGFRSAANAPGGAAAVEALRDPATGYGWKLVPGPAGAPGLWIRSSAAASFHRWMANTRQRADAPLVVRAGDRLIVSEETPAAAIRIAVVALEPARLGATLRVRPAIGNRVLRAVALGDGRAALLGIEWGTP